MHFPRIRNFGLFPRDRAVPAELYVDECVAGREVRGNRELRSGKRRFAVGVGIGKDRMDELGADQAVGDRFSERGLRGGWTGVIGRGGRRPVEARVSLPNQMTDSSVTRRGAVGRATCRGGLESYGRTRDLACEGGQGAGPPCPYPVPPSSRHPPFIWRWCWLGRARRPTRRLRVPAPNARRVSPWARTSGLSHSSTSRANRPA